MKIFVLTLLFSFSVLNAQTYELIGTITDSQNGTPLSYGNVRVLNTMKGSSANKDGRYIIRLPKGKYTLITSYIGFASDTADVNLNADMIIDFQLKRISLKLPTVTVTPGVNPADKIIAKALDYKSKRNRLLNSYIYNAYTKTIVRSKNNIDADNNKVTVTVGLNDTSKLVISNIIENESRGYYKKPGRLKEKIIARKQTANTSSTMNILTGGRLIQNFYGDDIQFFGKKAPSPLDKDAPGYYYYYISDSLAFDKLKVYKIYFNVIDDSDPGFYGNIYIADSIFSLVKIDANLNSAANPGGIFTTVNISQQFVPYDGNLFMPIDYRIKAEGNVYGLALFGIEVNSIFYDYEINPDIPDEFFDLSVLTVMPDADQKDSLYWNGAQTIPNTLEETKAYVRLDSLNSIERTLWEKFSFFSFNFPVSKHFTFSGPLSLYSFNRVEGHALKLEVRWDDFFKKRFSGFAETGYGFNDRKGKFNFSSEYLFGAYRTGSAHFSVFNKLDRLYEEFDYYNEFTSTVLNLFTKYDFRNYFYREGFEAGVSAALLPILSVGIDYLRHKDKSGFLNTDFSIFQRDKTFPQNTEIDEGITKIFKLSAGLDFRKYFEDGYFRRRLTGGKSFFRIKEIVSFGKFEGGSNFNFTQFHTVIDGAIAPFGSAIMSFRIENYNAIGITPFQYLATVPGNIRTGGKNMSFRTIGVGEIYGDRLTAFFIEHNFNDALFRWMGIPLLKKSQIKLGVHLSAVTINSSQELKNEMNDRVFTEYIHPFYEAGFSLGHPLFPFKLEFTWKLNYRGKDNFTFGINSIVL